MMKAVEGNNKKKIELLSPAGDFECFKNAINAGADAVYLGLKKYGARAYAGNFTVEELNEALDIAHLNNRRIYLTVNTLFKDDEYKGLIESLKEPYKYGLDGVIVQDIGLLSAIRYYYPEIELHASTQMAVTSYSAAMLLKEYGISRIVPARELSLDEIKLIHDKSQMELECFIHGAMCYSYSGKCLYSSFLGGRSGNRGRCAQPCRLTYDGEYILSMKDMCTLDIIDKLIDAGIYSFKIEGRMKSPEYVYNVTAKYRKYIDSYLSGKGLRVDKRDKEEILSLYTRSGNHEGYYYEKNGRDMITIGSPSYNSDNSDKGSSQTRDDSVLKCAVDINCRIKEGENIILDIAPKDGDNIYGNNYEESKIYRFISDIIPQAAIKAVINEELVKKQLLKTGGSLFEVNNIRIDIDEGLFVANGQLNQIRREAFAGFLDMLLSVSHRQDVNAKDRSFELYLGSLLEKAEALAFRSLSDKNLPESSDGLYNDIRVSVLNVNQISEVIRHDFIRSIIIPAEIFEEIHKKDGNEYNKLREMLLDAMKRGLNIYIKLPYIIRNDKNCVNEDRLKTVILNIESIIERIYNAHIKGYYISNYESLAVLKDLRKAGRISGDIIGDIHMYALAKPSALEMLRMGLTRLTVPVELNKKELLRRNIEGLNEELIVYGKMPMMVSTQCVLKTKGKCHKCTTGNLTYITDRKNVKLPVYCSCNECSNVIYNSVPLSIISEKDIFKRLSIASMRVMLTDESQMAVKGILDKLEAFAGTDHKAELADNYTKGHLNKGVE